MTSAVIAVVVLVPAMVSGQPNVQLSGVRLENAFRLPGSNSTGLVVSVTITDQRSGRTTDDFGLVLFGAGGRRSGTVAPLAMKAEDADRARQQWIILDDPAGTLARSYRAMVERGAAVVAPSRKAAIEAPGRYEFVFLIASTQTTAALAYGNDVVHRPTDVEKYLIKTFKVPQQ